MLQTGTEHETLGAPADDDAAGPVGDAVPPVIAAESAPGRRGPSRRVVVVLLVLGWLAGVAWRIWLTRSLRMPVAHVDEDSYLNAARVFAGGPGGYSSENGALRRSGYQLLISPAFLGDLRFTVSYELVRVINALVSAAALPLAYLLASRVLGVRRWPALGIAAVAAFMPAAVFYSLFALTDAVLATLTLAWILLLATWLRRPRRLLGAFGATAVAGAYYLVHVRGVVVLAVHVGVVLVWAVRRRIGVRPLLVALATAAGAVLLDPVLTGLLGDKLALVGNSPGGGTVAALTTPAGAGFVLVSLATQFWYVMVVSGCLAALGWCSAAAMVARRGTEPALRWTAVAALAVTLGVALGCALILAGVPAATRDAVYARYVHPFVPLWLVFGLAMVLRARRRVLTGGYLAAAALTLCGGALAAWRLADAVRRGSPLVYGVFGGPELMAMTAGWQQMRPMLGSVIGVGAGAVVVLLCRRRWTAAPVLAAAVVAQLVLTGLVVDRSVAPLSREMAPTPTLAQLGVRPGESVATSSGYHLWLRLNHQHEVTWMQTVDFVSDPPASAQVVVARWYPVGDPKHSWDWDGARHGFRRVGGNPEQHWALWRRIG